MIPNNSYKLLPEKLLLAVITNYCQRTISDNTYKLPPEKSLQTIYMLTYCYQRNLFKQILQTTGRVFKLLEKLSLLKSYKLLEKLSLLKFVVLNPKRYFLIYLLKFIKILLCWCYFPSLRWFVRRYHQVASITMNFSKYIKTSFVLP